MKHQIVCVGTLKETYFKDAVMEYQKRLTKFGEIRIIEVAEEKTTSLRENDIQKVKDKEGERILEKCSGYVILCDLEGKQCSSTQLSEKLEKIKLQDSVITFVIGGSYGVSEKVKNRADFLLCFSPMTFPHQLMRVILLEQVYRAETIAHHITYHK